MLTNPNCEERQGISVIPLKDNSKSEITTNDLCTAIIRIAVRGSNHFTKGKYMTTQIIEINKLHPFPENPFRVIDDTEMEMLIDSIKESGVLTPLIVRPDDNGEFEIISGHRRFFACKKAGLEAVPVIVSDMSREEARIVLVDTNLYRDGLLPSEKARGYRMKNEAIKRKAGRPANNSRQIGENCDEPWSITQIANTVKDSERTIQRYIRLTYLIPELLKMVDEKKIGFTPAIEISYLSEQQQRDLLTTIESEQATPSISQANRMRKLAAEGKLDMDMIFEIMTQKKANQKETLKIPEERIRDYFSASATPQQMEDTIVKALEFYLNHQRQVKRDRGAR